MANRTFSDVNALQKAVILLEGNVVINSSVSGKTQSLKGSGIKAIKNVSTGLYKVQLDDPYFRKLGGTASIIDPSTTSTAVTGLTPGLVYVIATLGNTTQAQWVTAGVPASVTAAVGMAFLCAATSAGTGTCAVPTASGIFAVAGVGNANLTLNNATDPHYFICCRDAAGALADPANGSVLAIQVMLRNSSVLGKGE